MKSRVSITMEASFCVETLEEALARHGKPEIFNTDQGSQFTGATSTDVLDQHEVRISMDGKGAWRDNVFVERLWRSVKYEEVYLRAYDNVLDARASIGRHLDLYNRRRPHSSLDGMTPDRAYFGPHGLLPVRLAAKPGKGSTHRSGKTVRTSGATSFSDEMSKSGTRTRVLCFTPRGRVGLGDIMLAQKLALELFEPEALAVAKTAPRAPLL